jgi:hypothetical protein
VSAKTSSLIGMNDASLGLIQTTVFVVRKRELNQESLKIECANLRYSVVRSRIVDIVIVLTSSATPIYHQASR